MPDPAGNVLIVEDDPDMREMLSTLLATEGFYAVGAEDGLEADSRRYPGPAGRQGTSDCRHERRLLSPC